MNIPNVIPVSVPAHTAQTAYTAHALLGPIVMSVWRRTRVLFRTQVLGNPLHEAWNADGEPLERMTPSELAKSSASRHIVVPHSRGR